MIGFSDRGINFVQCWHNGDHYQKFRYLKFKLIGIFITTYRSAHTFVRSLVNRDREGDYQFYIINSQIIISKKRANKMMSFKREIVSERKSPSEEESGGGLSINLAATRRTEDVGCRTLTSRD